MSSEKKEPNGQESSGNRKGDPVRYLPLILLGGGLVLGLALYYYSATKTTSRRNILEEIRDPNASIKPA